MRNEDLHLQLLAGLRVLYLAIVGLSIGCTLGAIVILFTKGHP